MIIDTTGWYLIASQKGKTLQESVKSYVPDFIQFDIKRGQS